MNNHSKLIHVSIANPVLGSKASPPVGESAVVFSGGEAGASSVFQNKENNAAKQAFDPGTHSWVTSGTLPQFLWYDFKNPGHLHCPIKISFLPRQDTELKHSQNQFPKKFQFIGTNDESCHGGSNWEVLCEAEYPVRPGTSEESRGCEVKGPCRKFRCFGIKVLQIYQGNQLGLDKVRMWVDE